MDEKRSAWERLQIIHAKGRPTIKDYIPQIFTDWYEMHGDRLFGDDRIVLVSDSMEAAGMPDGDYSLGGQAVRKTGNKAVLADGTIAGSVTDLYHCMLKAVEFGIPLESAVKAATCNPCRSIGIFDRYGSIEVGKSARFLILRQSDLSIKMVI